jgi:hypothetical protein
MGIKDFITGLGGNQNEHQQSNEKDRRDGDDQDLLGPGKPGPNLFELLDQLLKKVVQSFLLETQD